MAALIRRPAHPLAAAPAQMERRRELPTGSLDNARLFATGWAGGMIFFATFFS